MSLAFYPSRVRSSEVLGVTPDAYQELDASCVSKAIRRLLQSNALPITIVLGKCVGWKADHKSLGDSFTLKRPYVKKADAVDLTTNLYAVGQFRDQAPLIAKVLVPAGVHWPRDNSNEVDWRFEVKRMGRTTSQENGDGNDGRTKAQVTPNG